MQLNMPRLFIVVLAAIVVTLSVQADELSSELAASAYWRKPYDGVQRHQNDMRYGLRFDRSTTNLTPSSQPAALQVPAIVELEFDATNLSAFRIHGYDTLPQYTVANADGTGGTDWTPLLYIGGAALAMCLAGSTLCEQSSTPDTVCVNNPVINLTLGYGIILRGEALPPAPVDPCSGSGPPPV